jgi:hypothetical protein
MSSPLSPLSLSPSPLPEEENLVYPTSPPGLPIPPLLIERITNCYDITHNYDSDTYFLFPLLTLPLDYPPYAVHRTTPSPLIFSVP